MLGGQGRSGLGSELRFTQGFGFEDLGFGLWVYVGFVALTFQELILLFRLNQV